MKSEEELLPESLLTSIEKLEKTPPDTIDRTLVDSAQSVIRATTVTMR